jgi:hypothetical protein
MAPEVGLIVATFTSLDVQVPPALPFDVNVTEPVRHMACVPARVPAFGAVVTVTVLVVFTAGQPPVAAIVNVIVAVPPATPVTTPVPALTVAIPVALEVKVPDPEAPLTTNVVV